MQERRIATIFDALRPFMSTSDVAAWLQTLDSDGKWPDSEVDYTVGCMARRANWPAEVHWRRILLMSAAWHGDPNGSTNNFTGSIALQNAISKAMDFWFHRDLTNLQCIHSGGTASCPCDDPQNTFWNTNWFSNVILVPRDVGQVCLLLNTAVLTDYQVGKCKEMTGRSYDLFGQPFGFLEGANILDIARLGVDGALLTSNTTLISDAYNRIHLEMTLKNEVKADGIRPDGSFGQHKGLLYNGNYGKDFINGLVDLELVAVGTEFAASADIKASLETLIDGSKWMAVRNTLTKTTHWDLSALSRFLMFPVADLQATSGLRLTMTSLEQLGQKWGSSIITDFIQSMSKDTTSANAGDLVGNRHFYANDYMPFGFHLSDNAVRTYIRGDEYEDIAAAWDWYLIPGATIDYGATPLTCSTTKVTGLESFVGGVSDGTIGISLMLYTNPRTGNLKWQKAWFFLNDDVQHVTLSDLSTVSNTSAIRSVIEQRRQRGPVYLDDNQVPSATRSSARSLWHGDVGYVFSDVGTVGQLVVQTQEVTGNWATIGTSTQPNTTVRLFSAWIEHSNTSVPLSYSVLPGISRSKFNSKQRKLGIKTLQNDDNISAIFDEANKVIYAVFWQPTGGTITFAPKRSKGRSGSISLVAKDNIALIYKVDQREITVSDPSQSLTNTVISLMEGGQKSHNRGGHHSPGSSHGKTLQIEFPQGGMGGKSVTKSITCTSLASRRYMYKSIYTIGLTISNRLSSLDSSGKWPDSEVDYTTGCDARRANWPAQTHWQRILIMAGAWYGGIKGADQLRNDTTLLNGISSSMNYWFNRDFTNVACLDAGGTSSCPCSNPDNSLWNTNWFSNVGYSALLLDSWPSDSTSHQIILIPELVSQVCLLVEQTLTTSQRNNCIRMTDRSYNTFGRTINGLGTLTGANTLDVAKIGIDEALLTTNSTLLADAYRRVHLELQVKNAIKSDGIRADGSFGQHGGILYNGNYGKDYTNDVLDLEVEAAGTSFAAGSDSKAAFEALFDGDKWMIYMNSNSGVLHWDYSALGRFISFPVIDAQATGSIKINLTEVLELGQLWDSKPIIEFSHSLSEASGNANAGSLVGNRMFYANDYMVHRGTKYVSTLKMYSRRTQNTECVNSQNPKGFHLADGALRTYLSGDEYEDIAAAWDWNLVPGITVDYNATILECGTTQQTGVETIVGGVSDGQSGLAVMKFTNPVTKSLSWQKAWFFLDDDIQHVMVSGISSTSSPVYTVLDQRKNMGNLVIDNASRREGMTSVLGIQTLWHGDVGYAFVDNSNSSALTVQVGPKTGDWSLIGTSTQPPTTVDIFAAWIEHRQLSAPFAYTAFPGTTQEEFTRKLQDFSTETLSNTPSVSAVFDNRHQTAMVAFWSARGGTVTFKPRNCSPVTLSSDKGVLVMYRVESGDITISDPSQSSSQVNVLLTVGRGGTPPMWGTPDLTRSISFNLPTGGQAGRSITKNVRA
ncbi:hypothetical protein CVT24_011589 [Panaeolus cyanescens]|uniref:Polysaccharide lyase family 8 protein n=1 Tax=Panaeolus cyanescens TaxID=181874 RepID=A0A409YVA4_9AGAR|nr:hypothetical protein CVT24_011589 [Panaeolus cyanescens]